MEQDNIDMLKAIKQVEVADTVFEKISAQLRKNKAIPFYKIAIAAALILGLTIGEIALFLNQTADIIPITDNNLYYE